MIAQALVITYIAFGWIVILWFVVSVAWAMRLPWTPSRDPL